MEKYSEEALYKYPIDIYTESNPNPNSMKFMFNVMVVDEGQTYHFASEAETDNSPLAKALFGFDYVKEVFFMSNFITITKSKESTWEVIIPELKPYLKKYFQEDKVILEDSLTLEEENVDTEIAQKIKSILKEYIAPAVEMDGGAIQFHSFSQETGILTVLLQGACSGCPSSSVTLKNGIEQLMHSMLPEVKEVVAENI